MNRNSTAILTVAAAVALAACGGVGQATDLSSPTGEEQLPPGDGAGDALGDDGSSTTDDASDETSGADDTTTATTTAPPTTTTITTGLPSTTTTTVLPTTTTAPPATTEPENDMPVLPTLKPVRDPGTLDPTLGTFPIDRPRDVQFAWIDFATDGRDFVAVARQLDKDASKRDGTPATVKKAPESVVYMDGVRVCLRILQNYTVMPFISGLNESYGKYYAPRADPTKLNAATSIAVAAANTLCPNIKPVLKDPDLLIDTPTMLRSILGVGGRQLSNADANIFANWVCAEVDRGETLARITTTVADEYGYPDDTADELVTTVDEVLCGA